MLGTTKQKVVAGVVAGLAVAGGGGAIAATRHDGRPSESRAVLADAAHRLGVSPGRLTSALEAAVEKQIDAAVAAGRITKEQGAELKRRVESGGFPLVGLGGPPMLHADMVPGLDVAASYLGISEDALRSQLESGKTLADVAKAHGKSVAGLVEAMVAQAKEHLDEDVSAGEITQAQENRALSEIRARLTALANGEMPRVDRHRPPLFGFGRDDPPEPGVL